MTLASDSFTIYTSASIVELDPTKFEDIRDVINGAYRQHAHLFKTASARVTSVQALADELRPGGILLVLSRGDEAVATVAGIPLDNDSWQAAMVATKPKYVRRGFGTTVMRYLESCARSAQKKKIVLQVAGVSGSLPFYLHLGYSITRTYIHAEGGPLQATREYRVTTMELNL